MRTHTMHWIALVALAGCSSMDGGMHMASREADFQRDFPGGTLCKAKDCTVEITITAGCGATANPPILGVDTSIDDATIHWKILPGAPGSPTFTADGINPKPGSQWHREFKRPTPGDVEFTWLDKNKLDPHSPKKREYRYNIEFKQGGRTCRVDPGIVNDY